MAQLITYHVGADSDVSYRYVDEDWEVMACAMNDLPMYATEESAREAYKRAHEGVNP